MGSKRQLRAAGESPEGCRRDSLCTGWWGGCPGAGTLPSGCWLVAEGKWGPSDVGGVLSGNESKHLEPPPPRFHPVPTGQQSHGSCFIWELLPRRPPRLILSRAFSSFTLHRVCVSRHMVLSYGVYSEASQDHWGPAAFLGVFRVWARGDPVT